MRSYLMPAPCHLGQGSEATPDDGDLFWEATYSGRGAVPGARMSSRTDAPEASCSATSRRPINPVAPVTSMRSGFSVVYPRFSPNRWSGKKLSRRLAVSARTLRHDIEKLRQLGCPFYVGSGITAGCELRAGAAQPPLLPDDEEAVAMAMGLSLAAGSSGALISHGGQARPATRPF